MEENEEALELETLEVETRLVEVEVEVKVDPEGIASRERAHAMKVVIFLAGGEL